MRSRASNTLSQLCVWRIPPWIALPLARPRLRGRQGGYAGLRDDGTISLRTDKTTDTAPARLIRGINHRASEGNVTARLGARSRPAARLANTQSSGAPDGQSPIQAIATRTPRV